MKSFGILILGMGSLLLNQVAHADWTTAQRLTWNTGTSYNPDIAVDSSGALHVVWYDETPGNAEIFYRKSADGGLTWGAAKRLSWTSDATWDPAIAVDPAGGVHVVWFDYTPGNAEIYYKKSPDGGVTWGASQRLTWTSGGSDVPAIAAGPSGDLLVAWYDYTPGDAEIYYKRSPDEGVSWGSTQRLTWTSATSSDPALAVNSSGHVFMAWAEYASGVDTVYYRMSSNGGAAWTPPKRLTWSSGSSSRPVITHYSSAHLHLVWREASPEYTEVFYRKSTDEGATWTPAIRLTWTPGFSNSPAIKADSLGQLHVLWDDDTPGNSEIYSKKSPDEGATWTQSQRRTWTPSSSYTPAIAIDASGYVQVVWGDATPGNYEIFYMKGK